MSKHKCAFSKKFHPLAPFQPFLYRFWNSYFPNMTQDYVDYHVEQLSS